MLIAKVVIGVVALVGVTTAYADGFVVTRSLSNGREMRLVQHTENVMAAPAHSFTGAVSRSIRPAMSN
ncbi:hypothetical protein R75465_02455 [Paraburkholderia aspalathi]|nr:hypothetical protein R75465_02455 [Paraburkholderia aspalathi]